MIVRTDDEPTTVMPQVGADRPAPSALRSLAPWLAFGLVAVLVVGGAVAWSASLRGPQPATANLADAPAPPSTVAAVPTTAPAPQAAAPAPTVRRTLPRAAPKVSKAPVVTAAPVAPLVPAAPTVVATTTTTKAAVAADPTDPFGPGYVPGSCSGAAATNDPACRNAANPPGTGPATGR